jgi:hypothetical protein
VLAVAVVHGGARSGQGGARSEPLRSSPLARDHHRLAEATCLAARCVLIVGGRPGKQVAAGMQPGTASRPRSGGDEELRRYTVVADADLFPDLAASSVLVANGGAWPESIKCFFYY